MSSMPQMDVFVKLGLFALIVALCAGIAGYHWLADRAERRERRGREGDGSEGR